MGNKPSSKVPVAIAYGTNNTDIYIEFISSDIYGFRIVDNEIHIDGLITNNATNLGIELNINTDLYEMLTTDTQRLVKTYLYRIVTKQCRRHAIYRGGFNIHLAVATVRDSRGNIKFIKFTNYKAAWDKYVCNILPDYPANIIAKVQDILHVNMNGTNAEMSWRIPMP